MQPGVSLPYTADKDYKPYRDGRRYVACDRYVCFHACVTNVHRPDQSTTGCYGNIVYKTNIKVKLCRIFELTLTYQKFLLCVSS